LPSRITWALGKGQLRELNTGSGGQGQTHPGDGAENERVSKTCPTLLDEEGGGRGCYWGLRSQKKMFPKSTRGEVD